MEETKFEERIERELRSVERRWKNLDTLRRNHFLTTRFSKKTLENIQAEEQRDTDYSYNVDCNHEIDDPVYSKLYRTWIEIESEKSFLPFIKARRREEAKARIYFLQRGIRNRTLPEYKYSYLLETNEKKLSEIFMRDYERYLKHPVSFYS